MATIQNNTIVAVFKNGAGAFTYYKTLQDADVKDYNENYNYFEAKKSEVSIPAEMMGYSAKWISGNLVISEATSYVVLSVDDFNEILENSADWLDVQKKVLEKTGTKTEITLW